MNEKTSLPKDSLAKIVKIMEYLEENYNQVNVEDIKKKFKDRGWQLFQRYCIGGSEPYADSNSNKDGSGVYTLNQIGVRKLHELRKTLVEEKRNKLLSIFTFALALIAFWQTMLMLVSIIVSFAELNAKGFTISTFSMLFPTYTLMGGFLIIVGIGGFMIWKLH